MHGTRCRSAAKPVTCATARFCRLLKKKMKINQLKVLAAFLFAVSIAGCGGGSGGGTVQAASAPSFPLQAGYKSLVANGLAKTFSISGTCAGSGSKTAAPATTATTFNGVAALSSAITISMSLTNCTPASVAQTSTSYVDSNYVPLGDNSAGAGYGVFLAPLSIPASVSVGDTATVGTENWYTNSTKTTASGVDVMSYVVQSDTPSTAIIDLISKSYNAAGALTSTEQDYYRIDSTGALTPTLPIFSMQMGQPLIWF